MCLVWLVVRCGIEGKHCEWQYDMEKGTVLSVFGLAGGRCGIEGKHCVVVLMQ